MSAYPVSFEVLTDCLRRLPGVGLKSAQRMAFYLIGLPQEEAEAFAAAITTAKAKIHRCKICMNLTDEEICGICVSAGRDKSKICVVSDPRDVVALERSHEYDGVYHVLHGVISPLRRVGPDDLTIRELLARLDGSVKEVIMATNPDAEGEATAMYLSRLMRDRGVRVTRIAYGIPVGSNLEFADDATLFRALEGRREI